MRSVVLTILLLSSPSLFADRHCSQGLGWLTIVLSRIEKTPELDTCATQRNELLALIDDVKQDFELCGCPQSRQKLDQLTWSTSPTTALCLSARSEFQGQISQIRQFANDECGH